MIPVQNNFTAIRYTLAFIVAFCHLAELSQVVEFQFFYDTLNAPLAVHGFFILSGFLIYRSYERNSVWKEYILKRLKRIFPAYIVVVIAAAIALVSVSSYSPFEYFGSLEWWKYLISNIFTLNFLQPELPGVFQQNYMHAVNGSLWTIKIEVGFYLLLPILAWVLAFAKENQKSYWLLVILLLSAVYAEFFNWMFERTGESLYIFLHRQLPGKLCFFIGGILGYRHFDFFAQHRHLIGLLSLLLTAASLILGVEWLSIFSLPGIILWCVFLPQLNLSFLDRHDFSYGIYLWHFPLVQVFASQNWFAISPWMIFLVWLGALLALSAASWYGWEKKWIGK